jgi:hypothetical protein
MGYICGFESFSTQNISTAMNHDAAKKLFLEQAAAYYDEMKIVADKAPHGKIIALAEKFAVEQGRELIRSSLESIVDERKNEIESDQKKTARNVLAAELSAIADTM